VLIVCFGGGKTRLLRGGDVMEMAEKRGWVSRFGEGLKAKDRSLRQRLHGPCSPHLLRMNTYPVGAAEGCDLLILILLVPLTPSWS
jgi:hypothetical protein